MSTSNKPPTDTNDRVIRSRDLKHVTGLSRTTVWRLEAKGDFPQRLQLTTGVVGWSLKEVQAWMHNRHRVEAPATFHKKATRRSPTESGGQHAD